MEDELELEVFRAGKYGAKGDWGEESLDQLIADYDPALHEAPVTLDHAQSGPALGWVAGLRRSGDRMVARLRGVREELRGLLREGAFRKRSVEIYGLLPETGRPYLKAVSFLGAAAPAVKGLRDLLFSEGAGEVRGREEEFSAFELSDAPRIDFGEVERELRATGRWHPRWEELGVKRFLAAIQQCEGGDEDARSPAQWFAEFLKSLPPCLPMGEAAPRSYHEFRETIPAGPNVSAASIALHRRASALCQAQPEIDYARALVLSSRN